MNFRKQKRGMVAIILLFAMLNVKLQCEKDIDGAGLEVKYEFREPVAISPYRLDYNVGDTIWLQVNIPGKRLFDEKSNTRVLLDSASFTTIAQVDLLYNNPFIGTGPFASFVFPAGISAYRNNSIAQTFASINFGCSSSTDYNLRVGIVLIEKGVFGISFYNSAIQKCLSGHYAYSRLNYVFDVADTHKPFYQQLPFAAIGKTQEESVLGRLDRKAMVVINVR